MQSLILFDEISFDVEKLKKEYLKIEKYDWHQHFSDYDPGWKAIPLVSYQGLTGNDANKEPVLEIKELYPKFKKTYYLKDCPYLNELIDSFKCPKLRTRLMKMEPGTIIPEHSDTQGWRKGIARIHIPIITHEEVYFFVDGQRAKMKEGELWYMDVMKPHSVKNKSDITRVHLVIDLVVNKWLRNFFPKESFNDKISNFLHPQKKYFFKVLRDLRVTEAYSKIKNNNE